MDQELMEMEAPLSAREAARLAELEQVIKDNFKGFVAVGKALAEIRDTGLYRECGTFEHYCALLWDVSRPRAYQLMDSAKVIDNLSTIVDKNNEGIVIDLLPKNEAQARELARLQPEEQVQVWTSLIDDAKDRADERGRIPAITAKAVKKAAIQFKGGKIEGAIKRAGREPKEHRTEFQSPEFTSAFQAFLDQISIEQRRGWRNTSRKSVHKALLTVLEAVGEAGDETFECGCSMDLSEREKLQKAGFSIFRMNAKVVAVEKWLRNDLWAIHSEHESPAEMNAAFKALMADHTNLRG